MLIQEKYKLGNNYFILFGTYLHSLYLFHSFHFTQVCVANPPEALTSAGCAAQFPPGCDCDPEADNPDESCPVDTQCVQCKCLPLGCDCDTSAEDPDSFCPVDQICKVSFILFYFMAEWQIIIT